MDNPSLKLQEIMGTYYPNFLEIYVNTDKAVVLHKLSKKRVGHILSRVDPFHTGHNDFIRLLQCVCVL